jgi:hypothetical protein
LQIIKDKNFIEDNNNLVNNFLNKEILNNKLSKEQLIGNLK